MRTLVLTFAVGLGCGASSTSIPHHDAGPRPVSPAVVMAPTTANATMTTPTTAPPFALLGSPGDVFLLVAEHGQATCQHWTVVPGDAGAVQLRRNDEALDLAVKAGTIELVARSAGSADMIEDTTCHDALPAHELDGAGDAGGRRDLDVAGARWFARGEDCATALAQHRRVAMDLTRCRLDPVVPANVLAATHKRFDRVLARGGTMYTDADGTCRPVRVVAGRVTSGRLEGSFVSEQRSGRRRSVTSYNYEKERGANEITLLGPSYEQTDGDETISGGMGCGDVTAVDVRRDTALGMYFTRASCRAARAVGVANASWLPADADEAAPADDATPGDELAAVTLPFGGC